jgi:3-methylfumaryl-CoA hydratase
MKPSPEDTDAMMPETKPSLDYSDAIGREENREEIISSDRARAMAASLDMAEIPGGGGLPPAWHWLYFNAFEKWSLLGTDGHPRRGGFLPDVALPRRMWAGSRIEYHHPLPLDRVGRKRSTISKAVTKSGKTGDLVFITVTHEIRSGDLLCVREEQDIVYRGFSAAPASAETLPAPAAEWSEPFAPDAVLLFRYSALTSNGHRIHYDHPYATGEEGYPDLVVHGPLTATLLHGLACRARPHERLSRFSFRAVSPLYLSDRFWIEAGSGLEPEGLHLWARRADGSLAMKADAVFERMGA